MVDDADSWDIVHPGDRWIFDKLLLSTQLGYCCGPSGYDVPRSGWYVVRPIMNLSGMGAGASIQYLEEGDQSTPLGYFWCEAFNGEHISVDYRWGRPVRAVRGIRSSGSPLYRWDAWERVDDTTLLPIQARGFYKWMNAEYIGGRLIELHFRRNPDPDYEVIKPVWEGDETDLDWEFVSADDDADSALPERRVGFLVK